MISAIKKFSPGIAALLLLLVLCTGLVYPKPANAAFTANNLIDDAVFDRVNSMTPQAIDNFLNSQPGSCISANRGFLALDPVSYSPSQGFHYGANVTAGQVIYDAAQAYGINPQVLLVTLQKEQSLVSGGSCSPLAYAGATGYGCPDSGTTHDYTGVSLYTMNGVMVTSINGTCVNSAAKVGFSQQVIRAAWLLRFGEQRSKGNTGWAVINGSWDNSDDLSACYGGPMTQGSFKRCGSDANPVFYDGFITIDGASTHMDTGATAALYWYTPHFHGNQNFVSIFENWFGSTRSGNCLTSQVTVKTEVQFHKYNTNVDSADFMIDSGSGSGCIESHVWNQGYQSWQTHIASNLSSINTADAQVLFGDLDGSGRDYPLLFGLQNTGTGKIESHVWDHNMQNWLAHSASNQTTVNPTDCKILVGNLDGTKKDDVYLACMRNTSSGKIEIHKWNPGMQSWAWHAITNMPAIDTSQSTVMTGDIDGSGRDSLILVAYNHTGSGNVEFHIWNQGLWSWRAHIATNLPAVDPANANVAFADINGSGVDRAVLIAQHNTGSGRIEFHVWDQGYQSWSSHTASNQAAN